MALTTVPSRETGRITGRVEAGWFNTLKTAIEELQAYLGGGGGFPPTLLTLSNNVAATDVTGAVFSGSSYRSVVFQVDILRKTATASSEVRASGRVTMLYNTQDSVWKTDPIVELQGDDTGVTFTATTAGQLKYATTNIAGATYVGELYISAITIER